MLQQDFIWIFNFCNLLDILEPISKKFMFLLWTKIDGSSGFLLQKVKRKMVNYTLYTLIALFTASVKCFSINLAWLCSSKLLILKFNFQRWKLSLLTLHFFQLWLQFKKMRLHGNMKMLRITLLIYKLWTSFGSLEHLGPPKLMFILLQLFLITFFIKIQRTIVRSIKHNLFKPWTNWCSTA